MLTAIHHTARDGSDCLKPEHSQQSFRRAFVLHSLSSYESQTGGLGTSSAAELTIVPTRDRQGGVLDLDFPGVLGRLARVVSTWA